MLSSGGPPGANPDANLLPALVRRARPTAMPSRRRTRSSALPRATVKQSHPRFSFFLSHPVAFTCVEVDHRHKTCVLCLNKLKFASVLYAVAQAVHLVEIFLPRSAPARLCAQRASLFTNTPRSEVSFRFLKKVLLTSIVRAIISNFLANKRHPLRTLRSSGALPPLAL